MGLFIVSEAFFFVLLILAYVYFRSTAPDAMRSATILDPKQTGIYTALLIASSISIWFADRTNHRGSRSGMCASLIITVVLGGAFLFGQAKEYARLLGDQVTISRNLFGTTFFTLTGFHGLHVLLGLTMLAVILGLTLAGDFPNTRSSAVGTVSLYWHFVDVVWIVIFATVYLRVLS
jgi:heme/copper-type cytochrome/quinol oxidase subunit 3